MIFLHVRMCVNNKKKNMSAESVETFVESQNINGASKQEESGKQGETTKGNEKSYEGFEPVETPAKRRCPYLNCRV